MTAVVTFTPATAFPVIFTMGDVMEKSAAVGLTPAASSQVIVTNSPSPKPSWFPFTSTTRTVPGVVPTAGV